MDVGSSSSGGRWRCWSLVDARELSLQSSMLTSDHDSCKGQTTLMPTALAPWPCPTRSRRQSSAARDELAIERVGTTALYISAERQRSHG